MNTVSEFEKIEYEKLIKSLGLEDNVQELDEDKSSYFNAWHFGKSEEDCKYGICLSL